MCGARADTAPPKRFVCSMRIRSLKLACWRVAAMRARRLPIIFRCCARRRTSFPRKARCARHCVPAISSLQRAHTAKRMRTCRDSSKPARAWSTFLPTIALTTTRRMGCRSGSATRSLCHAGCKSGLLSDRNLARAFAAARAYDAPLQLIVDAKSGITGAGRKPATGSLYAEVAGDIRAYGIERHRHQPEIERLLRIEHHRAPLVFTPHVVPLARGMLADSYAVFDRALDEAALYVAPISRHMQAVRSSASSRAIAFPALPQ